MPEATITIAFIDPPSKPRKPGGKLPPWRIKDTAGNVWKMWDADRAACGIEAGRSEGQTYRIQYKEGEYDGKPDNLILDVLSERPSAPSKGPAMQQSLPLPQPYGAKDEIIFVEAMGKGFIDKLPEETALNPSQIHGAVDNIVTALRAVYQKHWGPKKQVTVAPTRVKAPEPEPAQEPEFSDEIPY